MFGVTPSTYPRHRKNPRNLSHLEVLACPALVERIQRRRLGSSNRRAGTSQKRCPDWAQVSEKSVSSNNGASERLRLFVPSRLWGFVSEYMPTNLWRVICLSRMSLVSKTVNSFYRDVWTYSTKFLEDITDHHAVIPINRIET